MGTLQERFPISAVIPTLNAAATLQQTLAALRRSAIVREIIVADGGSSDETLAHADTAGLDEDGVVALFTSALRDFYKRRADHPGAASGETEGVA